MPEQILSLEKQPAEKPFPWRCPKCRQPTVTRVTMPYRCQRTHDGRIVTVEVPNLAVPRCSNCGEVVFDYAADEQIRAAFRTQFGTAMKQCRSRPMLSCDDLRAMADHYRRVRKDVYEKATMPLDGSMRMHQMNKEKLQQRVIKLCNDANLNLYSGTTYDYASQMWRYLWRINRYAGISNTIASKEISDIASIFDDFTVFAKSSWDIEINGHKLIRAGDDVKAFLDRTGDFAGLQTVGNLPKLRKIVITARKLKTFLESKHASIPVLNFITGGKPVENVWEIHQHLMKLGYTADLTALHLMMDLGFQVIKPDIIISRLFLEWRWLHKVVENLPSDLGPEDLRGQGKYRNRFLYQKERVYKPVIDLARQIVAVTTEQDLIADIGWRTNNPLREFDIFIVKYGQIPDADWGLTRTLYKNGTQPLEPNCGSL